MAKKSRDEEVKTPSYYRERVRIDQDELDRCCAEQPELYSEISEQITNSVSARDQLAHDLAQKIAEVENKLRRKATKNEEKLTDKAVIAQVESDEEVIDLKEQLLQAKSAVLAWQGIRADFDMRRDMLKLLTQQFGDNYWSRESISASSRRYDAGEADKVKRETGKQRRREREPNRDDDEA